MKVLLINHFPLEGSGSGTYTKNIAMSLKQKGHQVSIVMPENTRDYNKLEGIDLYPVYFTGTEKIENSLEFNFPCFTSHPRSNVTFGDLSQEQINCYIKKFEEKLKQVIEEFKPDIIHVQHVWILAYVVKKVSSIYNIPYVITVHGTDLMGYDKWKQYREYAKMAIEGASHIISISKDNYDLIHEKFPGNEFKTTIMKNGYNPSIFYRQEVDRKKILEQYNLPIDIENVVVFAGKLAFFKGVDILIKAISAYEKKDKEKTIFIIIGNGELREELKNMAKKMDINQIYFIGNQSQETLRLFYNIADVSVVPSRREPFGLVAIEELACGSRVIATNEGGLADIINEKVGTLVKSEDEFELSEAIEQELNNKSKINRQEISNYAKKEYAQDNIITELINIYEKYKML